MWDNAEAVGRGAIYIGRCVLSCDLDAFSHELRIIPYMLPAGVISLGSRSENGNRVRFFNGGGATADATVKAAFLAAMAGISARAPQQHNNVVYVWDMLCS